MRRVYLLCVVLLLYMATGMLVPTAMAQTVTPDPTATPTTAPAPTDTPSGTPTPTDTPTPTLTPTPTAGGCTDQIPGAVHMTSAVSSGAHTISISWATSTDPVTSYVLTYGLSSGNYIYGNPSFGGQGTSSYTVGGLSTGTRYYFAMRAVNGCSTGSLSNEVSAVAGAVPTAIPTVADTTQASSVSQGDTAPTDSPTDTPEATITPVTALSSGGGMSVDRIVLIGSIVGVLLMIGVGIWNVFLSKRPHRPPVAL